MNIMSQLWNYSKLSYHLYSLSVEYSKHASVNTEESYRLIDIIQTDVIQCGAICIKFVQWLIPILDNTYIEGDDKPHWFISLENLYENCPIHSNEFSKEIYKN